MLNGLPVAESLRVDTRFCAVSLSVRRVVPRGVRPDARLSCLGPDREVPGTTPVIPLLMARLAGWVPPPRPWSAGTRRRTGQVMAGLAAASEVFQLHRYGFL